MKTVNGKRALELCGRPAHREVVLGEKPAAHSWISEKDGSLYAMLTPDGEQVVIKLAGAGIPFRLVARDEVVWVAHYLVIEGE